MINLTAMLVILAVFSIFFGYITKDMFIGIGTDFFVDNSIFIHPSHEKVIQTEFAVPTIFKLLPFIFTVALSVAATVGSENIFGKRKLSSFKLSRIGYNIIGLLNQRFLFESLYNKHVTNRVLKLGGQTTKVIDKGSIEIMGPYGAEVSLNKKSEDLSVISTGPITTIAVLILIGLIFMITTYTYIDTNDIYELIVLFIIILFYLVKKHDYLDKNIEKVSASENNSKNKTKTVSKSSRKSKKSSKKKTKSKSSSGKVKHVSTNSGLSTSKHRPVLVLPSPNLKGKSFSSSFPIRQDNAPRENSFIRSTSENLRTVDRELIQEKGLLDKAKTD